MAIHVNAENYSNTIGNLTRSEENEIGKLNVLSSDLLVQIFSYLRTTDLARCERVCKGMQGHILAVYTGKEGGRYITIWKRTIKSVMTLPPDLNPDLQGLIDTILHSTIQNRNAVARIAAGIPPTLKKIVADRVFAAESGQTQKVIALILLEAFDQACQIVNSSPHNWRYLTAIAQSMVYTGKNAEALLTYPQADLFMSQTIVRSLVAKGAKQEKLIAFIANKMQECTQPWIAQLLLECATDLIALGSEEQVVLAIANKATSLPGIRNAIVYKIVKMLVTKDATQEKVLAFITDNTKSEGQRDYALNEAIKSLAIRGSKQEDLLSIATSIKRPKENFVGRAIALAAGGELSSIPNDLQVFITNNPKSESESDRVWIGVVDVLAARGAELPLLLTAANNIVFEQDHQMTLRRIATVLATRGENLNTLLAFIDTIQFSIERKDALREIAGVLAARGEDQETLLAIATRIEGDEPDSIAVNKIAKALAARKGMEPETLLAFITQNMQRTNPWWDITLCEVAIELAVRGVEPAILLGFITLAMT